MRLVAASLASCGLLFTTGAFAQAADEDPTLIGAGLRARPAYEGAASNKGELVPVLRVYRGPLFARTTQGKLEGGARFSPVRGLFLGGQLAYEGGRLADDSAFLKSRGVPDLDTSASVGFHAEYDFKAGAVPLFALARYRRHIDSDRGAQADFRMTMGLLDKAGFTAAAFGQLTFTDRKEMRSYFGVSQSLSAGSGLATYDPGAGARFLAIGVLGSYDLGRHWIIVGNAEVHQMLGDAGSSPLVEQKTNLYIGLGIAYRM
jgi:outer membrane scaffolding protein for murein synthesis (MipA/OmpV family)